MKQLAHSTFVLPRKLICTPTRRSVRTVAPELEPEPTVTTSRDVLAVHTGAETPTALIAARWERASELIAVRLRARPSRPGVLPPPWGRAHRVQRALHLVGSEVQVRDQAGQAVVVELQVRQLDLHRNNPGSARCSQTRFATGQQLRHPARRTHQLCKRRRDRAGQVIVWRTSRAPALCVSHRRATPSLS